MAQPRELNPEQRAAADAVIAALAPGGTAYGPFLLHGVTGSGKTEVYLHVAAQALARGRQALILVPEINLTPRLMQHFRERFPASVIVALHSGLNESERLHNWLLAHTGAADIVLGTRLAILTLPGPDDWSTRSTTLPSSNRRACAIRRATWPCSGPRTKGCRCCWARPRRPCARRSCGRAAEGSLHHAAVGKHVAHPGGYAKVVLEHHKLAGVEPQQIETDYGDVHIARHLKAPHLAPVMLATVNQLTGNDAVVENLGVGVYVAEKEIERGDALGEAALDAVPLLGVMKRGSRVGEDRSVPSSRP